MRNIFNLHHQLIRKPIWNVLLTGLTLAVATGCATSSSEKKTITSAERAEMLLAIGNGALVEGDSIGALQNFIEVEKLRPDMPELHHSKALAYYAKQDLETAIREAKRAVELKPDYTEAYNTLGKLLIDAGKPDLAVAPLTRAASDPISREAYKAFTNLGIIFYRRNDFTQSQSYFDKAIASAPINACIAYYYRGHLELKNSKFSDAIRDYDLATRRFCAGFADAHLALGIAYEYSHRYDLARKKFLEIGDRFANTKVGDQAYEHLRNLP